MPYQPPLPDSKPRSRSSSGLGALIEAEKLFQIAFVLPSALVICWAGGWWLAHITHQKWIEIAGIVFGCITGLVYVIQMAISVEKKSASGDDSSGDTGKGSPNRPS